MTKLKTETVSELQTLRRHCAYILLSDVSAVELSGTDAEAFLQGRSSNDLKALKPGDGQLSAFLDRKGFVLAFASVHRLENRFLILTLPAQGKTVLKEFETYHFRERIEYSEISGFYDFIAVQGPQSGELLRDAGAAEIPEAENSIFEQELFGCSSIVIARSLSGETGFLILVKKSQTDEFCKRFQKAAEKRSVPRISGNTLDIARLEAGQALFGADFSDEQMLPETGLEHSAASYNKGCFQGQEVLARVKTYGAPRRALVGLIFEEPQPEPFPLNTEFFVESEAAGIIKSNAFSPTLGKHIAMCYIARDFRIPERKLNIRIAEKTYNVTVHFLPFYSAGVKKERAVQLYNKALQEFAHGSENKAAAMLREAIELDPQLSDAYESLGVILSRQEQYEEAIALMHKLQALEPDSIMAHTNLSIYHMHLGDKEKAEEEKAIAMGLRMTLLAKEHAQKKKEEQDRQKLAADAEKRLSMFQEVLRIDPDDFLANNGVGTIYVELGRFEEAIPYLSKVIEKKPTHTVAYLALGKAYENLQRLQDAIQTYRGGIEVAAKRGDISPMKEMQTLLATVEARSNS